MWRKQVCRFYTTTNKSPFEILSLPRTATEKEIKKKYYELAKTIHPDIINHNQKREGNNKELFHELSQAYQFLMQPEKRQLYLRTGFGWDPIVRDHHPPSPSSTKTTYYYDDKVTYRDGPWSSHKKTRYTSNATFLTLLSGTFLTIAILNFIYTPFATSWMKALDAHHDKSRKDLEQARSNAQRLGNRYAMERLRSIEEANKLKIKKN
ncbi:DnaJ domain-containing protein [Cunninghamella echinulata]|nr:DnaJ domain-containing protein [Cunninghamella echinulata]